MVFRKSQSGVKKLGAFRIKVQRFSSDAKKSSHAKLRDVQKTWKPCPQNGKNSQQKFRDLLQIDAKLCPQTKLRGSRSSFVGKARRFSKI